MTDTAADEVLTDVPDDAPPYRDSYEWQPATAAPCGFVPYPGNGAYGHWTCQLPRRHRGRHRFNNYTIPRVPRLWRAVRPVRWWVRSKWRNHRLFRGSASDYKTYPQRGDLVSWVRSAVYDARYEPVGR